MSSVVAEQSTKAFEEVSNNVNMPPRRHILARRRCGRIRNLPRRFPRVTVVCVRIFLPLFLLIMLAGVCGYWLAHFEAPLEYYHNDEIVAKRFVLESLPMNESVSLIGELPAWCFAQLARDDNNETLGSFDNAPAAQSIDQETVQLMKIRRKLFPNDTLLNSATDALETIYDFDWTKWRDEWVEESMEFMQQCGERVETYARRIISVNTELSAAATANEQTFNWIRCWNVTVTGPFMVWSPTEAMLQAATTQEEFYSLVWLDDQSQLLEKYLAALDNNATISDKADAWESSIRDASGSGGCTENVPGSAWFWFTVMTTVGYGNQSPESTGGRQLVITLGFLSMLAFGGVLAVAGNVVKLLYMDLTSRSRFSRVFACDYVATVVWGSFAISWMYILGVRAGRWWNARLDIETTNGDQFWFGYISSTTVGLGDYYLQPEVMFMKDVFSFSILYLSGFVYTSTFLYYLGETLSKLFPRLAPGEELMARLEETNFMTENEPTGSGNPPESQGSPDEVNQPTGEDSTPSPDLEETKQDSLQIP